VSKDEQTRILNFAKGKTSDDLAAGFLVHTGPHGLVVILVVDGGPTIKVELDVENGRYLRHQLDMVLRHIGS
jgi:hypothetical protein